MINVNIAKARKCNGEYSLYLNFEYNTKILDVVRGFSTRYWDTENKVWEVPFNKLGELINRLPEEKFDITGEYVPLEKPEAKIPEGFTFKTTPFQHQIEGFNYGLQYDRWLLGDEQGLGKTKQVIDIAVAKKLQKGYKHCLIICGVNGLKWNWVNEIATHSNEEAWILGQTIKNHKTVIEGNVKKFNDLLDIMNGVDVDINKCYFIITNVESLRDDKISEAIKKLCDNGTFGIVAIDEIHKCKNPASQQGKGILKVQPECRIAMTGTPLMNQPLDLYIILKWLGYEKHSFYAFKNHHCVMGGYGGYQVIDYKNLDELREQLEDIMLRRKKEEVLDLPAKLYVDEYVEMTDKQARIYKEVTDEIQANIDMIATAPNPLAQLIRMRQATGYTGILSSTIQESAKLDRMEELVEEAVQNGKQVVIFSNWTQMTDAIYERLHKKYPLSVVTGQTADEVRQHNVKEFQEGRSKVMIGTIGAMGTGLTLTAGTVEIFMDEPWNRANKEQAEDRCHRVGTTENVTIYTIMAKNTIDERIHEIVYKKGAMADMLVDGKVTTNPTDLIRYLLS